MGEETVARNTGRLGCLSSYGRCFGATRMLIHLMVDKESGTSGNTADGTLIEPGSRAPGRLYHRYRIHCLTMLQPSYKSTGVLLRLIVCLRFAHCSF